MLKLKVLIIKVIKRSRSGERIKRRSKVENRGKVYEIKI
jgi:hypothetical protein